MKNTTFPIIFTILFSYNSFCQAIPINEPDYNKPALFADVRDSLSVNASLLLSIFNSSPGNRVEIPFSNDFTYSGVIQSILIKFGGKLSTLIVKSTNRNGSTFTLSKIINNDGTFCLKGRIISYTHNDGFDLLSESGAYWLQKIKRYNLIVE